MHVRTYINIYIHTYTYTNKQMQPSEGTISEFTRGVKSLSLLRSAMKPRGYHGNYNQGNYNQGNYNHNHDDSFDQAHNSRDHDSTPANFDHDHHPERSDDIHDVHGNAKHLREAAVFHEADLNSKSPASANRASWNAFSPGKVSKKEFTDIIANVNATKRPPTQMGTPSMHSYSRSGLFDSDSESYDDLGHSRRSHVSKSLDADLRDTQTQAQTRVLGGTQQGAKHADDTSISMEYIMHDDMEGSTTLRSISSTPSTHKKEPLITPETPLERAATPGYIYTDELRGEAHAKESPLIFEDTCIPPRSRCSRIFQVLKAMRPDDVRRSIEASKSKTTWVKLRPDPPHTPESTRCPDWLHAMVYSHPVSVDNPNMDREREVRCLGVCVCVSVCVYHAACCMSWCIATRLVLTTQAWLGKERCVVWMCVYVPVCVYTALVYSHPVSVDNPNMDREREVRCVDVCLCMCLCVHAHIPCCMSWCIATRLVLTGWPGWF
jgi:hypothetical protein